MSNKVLHLVSFGVSDVGLVRAHNEDVWSAYPECGLFILADGMGGHSAGEVAAKEAVEYLYALFIDEDLAATSLDEGLLFFEEAFDKINLRIYQQGQQDEELRGMGTTLCALFLQPQGAVLTHVGDSRIYRLRDSQLMQLTEDHSLVNEMIALGASKSRSAETFSYKHILTRAIGTHPTVEATLSTISVEPHDLFMLCSDGLTNYVNDEQIGKILEREDSLQQRGEALILLAKNQGGGDNITLILTEYDLSRQ